jgi:hypothetical protein
LFWWKNRIGDSSLYYWGVGTLPDMENIMKKYYRLILADIFLLIGVITAGLTNYSKDTALFVAFMMGAGLAMMLLHLIEVTIPRTLKG